MLIEGLDSEALDRQITGNYGEDGVRDDRDCRDCLVDNCEEDCPYDGGEGPFDPRDEYDPEVDR